MFRNNLGVNDSHKEATEDKQIKNLLNQNMALYRSYIKLV